MPLCPQITNTAVTVTSTGMTTTSVTPIVSATTSDTDSLSTRITTAQSSADGKNKINYSTSGPSGSGTNVGDIWWQYSAGVVIAQYSWTGASWASSPISSAVIANLDAAKITSGIISSIEYNNGSGTFHVTAGGALTATSATITGAITATSGSFTGAVYASSGSFTGALTSTAGDIGGWKISTDRIYTGASPSSPDQAIYSAGGALFTGTTTCSALGVVSNFAAGGTVTAGGELYAAGHTTTANAANGYVFTTGGRIARSTASSERYKENIVDLLSVPELDPKKLLALPVRAFTYKAGQLPETDDRFEQMIPGFIAEEVDAIYPVAADYVNGPESWNDRMIVPALLSLVQELYKRVEELEAK